MRYCCNAKIRSCALWQISTKHEVKLLLLSLTHARKLHFSFLSWYGRLRLIS